MKKHVILFFLVFSALVGYNLYCAQGTNELSDIALANAEALAEGESSGNTVDCYSSSDSKRGASYYDCGTCSRQFNSVGTGNMRQCTAR